MELYIPSPAETAVRFLLIMILSGLIGAEREAHERPAGLRTHVLVGLGSCLFMMVSIAIALQASGRAADPGRIAANVVTGIGFLGAGTIWLRGDVIRGLTTAASIWATAAIGLTVGIGWYAPAIAATLLVFGALTVLRYVERSWFQKGKRYSATMRCIYESHPTAMDDILSVFTTVNAHLTSVEFLTSDNADMRTARITLNLPAHVSPTDVTRLLQRMDFVKVIEWE